MRHYSFRGSLTIVLLLGAGASFAAPADSRLADAAMRGDREAVRSLLTDRSNINAAQTDGTTALHWAAPQRRSRHCGRSHPSRRGLCKPPTATDSRP